MKYEVVLDKQFPTEWRAEAIDSDGSCFVVVFAGPDAEKRARQYADWQNSNTCKHEKWKDIESASGRDVVCEKCSMSGERDGDGIYYPAT